MKDFFISYNNADRPWAIGLAEWLFSSRQRIGQLRPEDLDERSRHMLELVTKLAIVDVRVKTGGIGHAYYHSNAAVSSDIYLALRDVAPGSPQRPLTEAIPNYWVLDDDEYPFVGENEPEKDP